MFTRKKTIILYTALLLGGICGVNWFFCGFIGTIWSFLLLMTRMGRCIPVLELPMVLGGIQWVLAPYLSYHLSESTKYEMLLEPAYYFGIIAPAYLFFCLGIELFNARLVLQKDESVSSKFIWIILVLGLLGKVLAQMGLGVGSFFTMLSSLLGVAAIFALFFFKGKSRFFVVGLFVLLLIQSSLSWGGFHEILVWGFWFTAYVLYKWNASRKVTVFVLVLGLFAVGILQGIKWDYRDANRSQDYTDAILFTQLASNWVNTQSTYALSDENFVLRFNQGWHISEVILYMDSTGKYLNGSSIWDSVRSILLPRVLVPNKRMGGGRQNFEIMTAHDLTDKTSMNISYIGEGYGNWGKYGAWFFPFAVGILLGLALRFTIFIGRKYREILYFVPIIFFYALKVEGDFFMTFNQYVKLTIIAVVLIFVFRKFLSVRKTEDSLTAPQTAKR